MVTEGAAVVTDCPKVLWSLGPARISDPACIMYLGPSMYIEQSDPADAGSAIAQNFLNLLRIPGQGWRQLS